LRRLEVNVLESFQYLLRKPEFVRDLKIDPTTFGVTLIAEDGRLVRKDKLSAGEKQILAISILWGLARSSSRALPVAIDTPLGRLDSVHRANLVEKYFPKAAHQVLLFSTDTEIDRPHLESLRPHITRAYHLQYQPETESVDVSEGYFW
jgi:DNA sulfur modification protein DndD